jgi:hypothetical protein
MERRGFEHRDVGIQRQSQTDRVAAAFRFVIVAQFGAQPVALHPDNFKGDEVFVDLRRLAGYGLQSDQARSAGGSLRNAGWPAAFPGPARDPS